jgi:pyrroline-5-carboxylate reductase
MTETLPDLLLIGCGKMGGAMLSGWLERGLSRAVVVEPHAPAAAAFAGRGHHRGGCGRHPGGFRPAP